MSSMLLCGMRTLGPGTYMHASGLVAAAVFPGHWLLPRKGCFGSYSLSERGTASAWPVHPFACNPHQTILACSEAYRCTTLWVTVCSKVVFDRVEVGTDQLPEAFEGEERSIAGVGDVLQLVSGQQLLGVVRERQDARLPGPTTLPSCKYLRQFSPIFVVTGLLPTSSTKEHGMAASRTYCTTSNDGATSFHDNNLKG